MIGKSYKYILDLAYPQRRLEILRDDKIFTDVHKNPNFYFIIGLIHSIHLYHLQKPWDQG